MPGVGDHHAARVRRQRRRGRHRTGRHQAVAATGDPQARHLQLRQFARAGRARRAAPGLPAARAAAGSPRSNACTLRLRSSSCACGEPSASSARKPSSVPRKSRASASPKSRNSCGETPCGQSRSPATKRGDDAIMIRPRTRLGMIQRGAQRELPAQRPAQPHRVGHARDQFGRQRLGLQRRGVVARVAVAGQVDQVQRVAIGQAIDQRREQAAVHGPAVDHCQRGTLPARFDVHVVALEPYGALRRGGCSGVGSQPAGDYPDSRRRRGASQCRASTASASSRRSAATSR